MLAVHLFGTAHPVPRSPLIPSLFLSSNELSAPSRPFVLDTPGACDLWPLTASAALPAMPQPALDAGSWSRPFGNFYLSSCPGKKVRIGAPPVKGGRSGICRDLMMDLQRAKDEGVRLIVCCLDDQGALPSASTGALEASCLLTRARAQNSGILARRGKSTPARRRRCRWP